MTERRPVTLPRTRVLPLAPHLLLDELTRHFDDLGDCCTCRGTGTVVVMMCLAGDPHTPVKDCPACTGTGWTDRVARTPHTPLPPRRIPL